MNVGWVGAGKLGLPCALAVNAAGHKVTVTDVNPEVAGYLTNRKVPYLERRVPELLETHSVEWRDTTSEVVAESDVVFVAVQTPHAPHRDGTHPLDGDKADFEYGYLIQAVREVCAAATKPTTVVVVSTVLPGTFNRHLRHLSTANTTLVYNPFFIAMGATVDDFLTPEFVLLGVDESHHTLLLRNLYESLHDRPIRHMSIESAELTKVAYNTFIGLKVAFANLLGEVCDKTGADVDDVTDALCAATDRVISPRYMRAGMGDGGGCHPRDNLAMSWLADRLDLHHDLFATLMQARENHSAWLADMARNWSNLTGLGVVMFGKSYKPGTNLTVGSPAALLAHQLGDELTGWWDPWVDEGSWPPERAVYVIATQHTVFAGWEYPTGSVVLDPFGYVPDVQGVTVVRPGRKRHRPHPVDT
jgi:UDPglucose 6-dehydrogenase